MEEQNIKLEITGDTKELVIRTGEAIELKNPERLKISGSILAPAHFAEMRGGRFDPLNAHVKVDYQNFKISLVVNDKDVFGDEVTGALVLHPDLDNLKVNNNKLYSPRELYDAIKFMGMFFPNRDQYTALCTSLTNFKSRVETDFENSNDFKGNAANSKLTKIKTDLGLKFMLSMPIFKGIEESKFEVDICLDTKDGGVICWLESVDLHTLKHEIAKKAMDTEIAKLKHITTIFV